MDLGPRPERCDDDPTSSVRYLNRMPAGRPARGARSLRCVPSDGLNDDRANNDNRANNGNGANNDGGANSGGGTNLGPRNDGAGALIEPRRAARIAGARAASTGADSLRAGTTRVESMRAAVSVPSPGQALRSIVDMAMDCGAWDAAGLMTVDTAEVPHSACASCATVGRLDVLQHTLRQGPAFDSLRNRGRMAVLSGDLDAERRWPRWRPAATGAGFASLISLRLFTDSTLGVLNLYAVRRYLGDDDDALAEADAIAAQASVVLAYTASEQRLWQAIEQQNTVGQAQGILMQRYGVTAAGAGAVLRRYAEHQEVDVADLARRITSTRQAAPGADESPLGRPAPDTLPFLFTERRSNDVPGE